MQASHRKQKGPHKHSSAYASLDTFGVGISHRLIPLKQCTASRSLKETVQQGTIPVTGSHPAITYINRLERIMYERKPPR